MAWRFVRSIPMNRKRQACTDIYGTLLISASGDIILALNGSPIKNTDQLRALVEHSGKTVALLVQRDDTKIFVPLDLS